MAKFLDELDLPECDPVVIAHRSCAMTASTGRILLPDRISLKKLKSLAAARYAFRSQDAHARLKQRLEELIPNAEPTVAAEATTLLEDPFAACVLIAAAQGSLKLYVAHPADSHCYQLNSTAMGGRVAGYLPGDSIVHGHFVVASPLMLHASLEVQLNGQAILACPNEVQKALKMRPTSRHQLEKIVKEVIEEARSRGAELTREQQLANVRKHETVHGVSDGLILAIFRKFKPPEWSKPGPKSRSRDSE
jgi:hypothetical protein